jgi:hypothetical protein
MEPDPKVKEPVKSMVKMTQRVRYPNKKGGKTEVITIEEGQMVKCSREVAQAFIDSGAAEPVGLDEYSVLEL